MFGKAVKKCPNFHHEYLEIAVFNYEAEPTMTLKHSNNSVTAVEDNKTRKTHPKEFNIKLQVSSPFYNGAQTTIEYVMPKIVSPSWIV